MNSNVRHSKRGSVSVVLYNVAFRFRREDDRRHVQLQVHRGVGADQRQGGRPVGGHHQPDQPEARQQLRIAPDPAAGL